ncbi:MAG: methylcrotonoyl-CoA carboxylase [Bacteroides sp. SM23_62]|nr:MAG: methylcrotonoyl-CoA carboxylase [Bacteroides sp. SM23_62]
MFQIQSNIDVHSAAFKKNQSGYRALLDQFHSRMEQVHRGGPESAIKKHKSRNKLLARERIDLLVDRNTPFLELSSFAAWDQYRNQFPAAGIVTGIGLLHNRETVIIANDATVKGGTYIEETIKKHIRAQEIALENHIPIVYMVDSGGVFLPEQDKVFPDKYDFGRIFFNQSRLSAEGIPQVAIVMGSCTAGGAYVPAMSDEAIIVRNQGTIFIGGPPLVKAATGEDVSAEELGGADVHTRISGVADHLAENDTHAIQICRNIFEQMNPPLKQELSMEPIEPPACDPAELYGLIPVDPKKPIDPREIIMRLVDGSKFQEFKQHYAPTIVTGFARIMGYPVGIIANNGVLFSETSLKATHFIELCNFRKTPILFLQNITGFIVGKEYEHKGIAKDGAKLVHAVSTASVPKFTVIIGGSYGAGNYAMAGRAFDPRLLFMWPNARISVMGGEQAAEVLSRVKIDQLKAAGEEVPKEEIRKIKEGILHKYADESSAWYSTSRLWDDGIIDPVDTRKVVAMGIAMSLNKPYPDPRTGVYRM